MRYLLFRSVCLGVTASVFSSPVSAQLTGASSSDSPYFLPVAAGVRTTAILTVGDSVNQKPGGAGPYRMVGLPDGLGAFDNGDGTFTLLMNHEIGGGSGAVRAHGSDGGFVSRWTIRTDTTGFQVLQGRDQVTSLSVLPGGPAAMSRLCAADLPLPSAFFNSLTGLGTTERIFLNGEEAGLEGRAFGHIVTGPDSGQSFELPRLGNFSFENVVANPASGDKTVVIGTDDSFGGQVYLYVGTKTGAGSTMDRAGLTNGSLYGIKVLGAPTEDRSGNVGIAAKGGSTAFTLENFGDVSAQSGAQLEANSGAQVVTGFLRPEDGAWDPGSPNDFYFVTTDRFDMVKAGTGAQEGRSRLWRLRFADLADPQQSGTLTMLLDGTEPHQSFDNLTIDRFGNILLQEDPGSQAHDVRIWQYRIADGDLKVIAQQDVARFGTLGVPATAPFTNDVESSGIMDASHILGDGWFLFDVMAHYAISDPELLQGGQLLALYNPDSAAVIAAPEPSTAPLLIGGSALLLALGSVAHRRRRTTV